jgi:hypothetical protein
MVKGALDIATGLLCSTAVELLLLLLLHAAKLQTRLDRSITAALSVSGGLREGCSA